MKKNFFSWMTIALMALVSVGFTSCGDNDSDTDEGVSYDMTDTEAIATLQGTWSVTTTEFDDEEGDVTWTETWVIEGNRLIIIDDRGYETKWSFSVKDGVFEYGYSGGVEKHRFTSLTASCFITSDAEFTQSGRMIIKMVGTKRGK